ncbi:MAG: hypothetical protein C0445_01875 [Polaromonas sp.]|nr:hypothetical protein [Polaromonas sp.]
MWHALVWLVVVALLLAWTLAAWLAHAVVGWAAGVSPEQLAEAGQNAGAVAQQLGQLPLVQWMLAWWPAGAAEAWAAAVALVLPWMQALVTHLPSVMGWLSPVVWVLWALGVLVLLLSGAGGSAVVHLLRQRVPPRAVGN